MKRGFIGSREEENDQIKKPERICRTFQLLHSIKEWGINYFGRSVLNLPRYIWTLLNPCKAYVIEYDIKIIIYSKYTVKKKTTLEQTFDLTNRF